MKSYHFKTYYLLVITIILLTIATQSIIRYSLNERASIAKLVNRIGEQRMLVLQIESEFYKCRYNNCDYAKMKLSLEKWYKTNKLLQIGNVELGIVIPEDREIQANFDKLDPFLTWIYHSLRNFDEFDMVAVELLSYYVEEYLSVMNEITAQYETKFEDNLKTMMVIELELAIFSIVIVLIEIFFIVMPIIRNIINQKQKLEQIAWHQSHVFESHMKNIDNLRYVLRVEKSIDRRAEIYQFIMEELDGLGYVSKSMKASLSMNSESKEGKSPEEKLFSR